MPSPPVRRGATTTDRPVSTGGSAGASRPGSRAVGTRTSTRHRGSRTAEVGATGALSVRRRVGGAPSPGTTEQVELHPVAVCLTGLLAALQGMLWSWLVVVVPAVAGFVSGAATVTTDATWRSAVGVGSRLWLLGHGVPWATAGATVAIVPLGLTMIVVGLGAVSLRRTARPTVAAWGTFVVGYVAVVVLVAVAVHGSVWRGLLGGLVIALLVVAVAARRGSPGAAVRVVWRRMLAPLRVDRPGVAAVRLGARCGAAFLVVLIALAALLVMLWAVAGLSSSEDIVDSLGLDLTSGVVFALAQTMLVPNLVWWGVSWLTGAGFAVGAGTSFVPSGAVLGPFPALPLLGGLPVADMAGGMWRWAPAAVVVLAAAFTVILWRRLRLRAHGRPVSWVVTALGALGFVASIGGIGVLAALASGGAAGPGGLATVGVPALDLTGRLLLEAGVPCIAVLLIAHPAPRRALARVARRGWTQLTRSRRTD